MRLSLVLCAALACVGGRALAVESCELNGQHVDPSNGRVAFFGDDNRDQASAEFNAQGQLYELRCGPRPMLGPDADDARWCGHVGAPSTVVLCTGKGVAKARVSYERGEARKSEMLDDGGVVRELHDTSASGGTDRSFYADGGKRREVQWVAVAGDRSRRVTTLEQEFHESGKKAFEGAWSVAEGGERRGSAQPTGVHRSWDSEGHLRAERFYDERRRVTHEREIDAGGAVVRDDEVFEDGSRKAFGR
jgi:hypothetical protein